MKKIRRFFKLLFRSSTGTAGMVIVILICLCAIFASQLAPYEPQCHGPDKYDKTSRMDGGWRLEPCSWH